ncbi:polysaccharide export protein [Cobetia amphilecti]|uniref:Polysaccharide export protein n=1 Tax=Cobetia amphilecti TaxID=1055104 RepID=A0AAP4TXM7_9GAMM|nr:polysaccharide export protein [Cobetia amphilecti]MDO6670831.1 polysaccharide export protein [Cobetia amphilecti]
MIKVTMFGKGCALSPRPRLAMTTALLIAMLSTTGCAFAPGGDMDYQTETAPLDDALEVKPITFGMVDALNDSRGQGQRDNQLLEQQLADYDYRIGRGDVLNIIVYDHPELTIPAGSERSAIESGNSVHSDGTIFYPYIGRVKAAGLTVKELRAVIERRLSGYIASPQIDVQVAAFKSQKVYVTGQVETPGILPITNVPLTILDAVNQAGGLSPLANWHDVVLTRDDSDEHFSLYDLLQNGALSNNRLLRDGDVLHIPDVGNQKVYVMGEVQLPGSLAMGNSRISLTDAIAQSGGIDEGQADAKGIFVVRRADTSTGKLATVYQLDARDSAAFVIGAEFMLQPSDVVYVTAAPLSRWNRVVNQLMPTLTAVYQVTRSASDFDDLRSDD